MTLSPINALLLVTCCSFLAAPPEPATLTLSLSRPTPLVDEEVSLFVDLLLPSGPVAYAGTSYPHWPVRNMSLTLGELGQLDGVELVKPLETLIRENAVEPGRRGFRINDLAGEVKLQHDPGTTPATSYRRRFAVPLRFRAATAVTLPAAHTAGEIYVPSGNRGRWERFTASSLPLTVTPLDVRNRPDRPTGFQGLVGPIRVQAQATPTKLTVGTPMTLRLRLEGTESLASATAPDLAALPEFRAAFRVRHAEERTLDRAREFTYVLRPLNDRIQEIPPIAVSYYDPQTKEFATARSAAIPLEVVPSSTLIPDSSTEASSTREDERSSNSPISQITEEADSFWAWMEAVLAVSCLVAGCVWGFSTLQAKHKAGRAARLPLSP